MLRINSEDYVDNWVSKFDESLATSVIDYTSKLVLRVCYIFSANSLLQVVEVIHMRFLL